MIVVVPPATEDKACMPQTIKHFCIQAFVTQPAFETLDEAIFA